MLHVVHRNFVRCEHPGFRHLDDDPWFTSSGMWSAFIVLFGSGGRGTTLAFSTLCGGSSSADSSPHLSFDNRQCASDILNLSSPRMFFFGTPRRAESSLYCNQEFTAARSQMKIVALTVHFLVRCVVGYRLSILSDMSAPPMLRLYSSTTAGRGMSWYTFSFFDHPRHCPNGASPT